MNDRQKASPTSPAKRGPRPGVTVALVPLGALLGYLAALIIEIIIGFLAGAYYNAERPAGFSWSFMGSLPGLGALIGAVVIPILYVRSRRGHPPTTR